MSRPPLEPCWASARSHGVHRAPSPHTDSGRAGWGTCLACNHAPNSTPCWNGTGDTQVSKDPEWLLGKTQRPGGIGVSSGR